MREGVGEVERGREGGRVRVCKGGVAGWCRGATLAEVAKLELENTYPKKDITNKLEETYNKFKLEVGRKTKT